MQKISSILYSYFDTVIVCDRQTDRQQQLNIRAVLVVRLMV